MWSNLLRVAEMHRYEATGNILNPAFCTFRGETNVCRKEENLTGICSRQACPIAYTKYATVREEHGAIFLYMKRANRNAPPPGYHWEKLKLSSDSFEAISQLKEHLLMQSMSIQNKCMEDFLKITNRLLRRQLLKKRQPRYNADKFPVKQPFMETRMDDWLQEQRMERLKALMYKDSTSVPKQINVDSVVNEEQEQELGTAKHVQYSRELNIYELMDGCSSVVESRSEVWEQASLDSGYESNLGFEMEDYQPNISLCPMNCELDGGYYGTFAKASSSSRCNRRKIELHFEVGSNPRNKRKRLD